MINAFLLYLFIRRYLFFQVFFYPMLEIILLFLSNKEIKNDSSFDSKGQIADKNNSNVNNEKNKNSSFSEFLKPKIKIYGYQLLKYGNKIQNKKYFISEIFKNKISDLSYEMYNYYKRQVFFKNFKKEKNSEIASLFVECLASLNCDWKDNHNNFFKKLLFDSTNWTITNNQRNNENNELIVDNYIKYKLEDSLKNKILLNNNIIEDNHENLIINNHYQIGIIKNFYCDENKYIITKIVRNMNDKYFKIFCQGNPYSIKNICKKETIPDNFENNIKNYILNKKIIIALAGKLVKMNYLKAQKIERKDCEKNMIFLGFVILDKS